MRPVVDHLGLGKPLKADNEDSATRLLHRSGYLTGQRATTGKDTDTAPAGRVPVQAPSLSIMSPLWTRTRPRWLGQQ